MSLIILQPGDANDKSTTLTRLREQTAFQPKEQQRNMVRKCLGKSNAMKYEILLVQSAYAQGALDAVSVGLTGEDDTLALTREVKQLRLTAKNLTEELEEKTEHLQRQVQQAKDRLKLVTENKDEEIRQLRAQIKRLQPEEESPLPPEAEDEPPPPAPTRVRRRLPTT